MTDKKIEFVKMMHMDTRLVVDVHPLEQLNYFRGGYRKIEKNPRRDKKTEAQDS
jgi:hypothetical protein